MKNGQRLLAAALAIPVLTLAACSSSKESASEPPAASGPKQAVAITYDGGVQLFDGETLEHASTLEIDGFNRINPAGDDQHIFVSTARGFEVLDTATGELTGRLYAGEAPGHVVLGENTVLFIDGTGEVISFDPANINSTEDADFWTYTTAEPHHGVAVELSANEFVVTLGNSEGRPGAIAIDADGHELARNEECPGVHGEAVAKDHIVGVGCKDGVLLYQDGAFHKIDGGRDYAAVGTMAGSSKSSVLLADFKVDPDAEREFPTQFSLIDTVAKQLTVVPMPNDASYSFRSLGRGINGEAVILATDGNLHVFNPDTAELVNSWPVVEQWQEPMKWQESRPALFVRGDAAYITDPAKGELLRVSISTGKIEARVSLEVTPNEISGVASGH